MTKKSNKSELIRRRAAMKTLLAGGGAIVSGISLPRNCSGPIVDAVVLPAHA